MNLFKNYKMRNDKTLEELEYLSKKANRWGYFITSISLIFFLILLVNILNNNYFINYPPILILGLALILMSPLSLAIPFLWLMEGFQLIIIEKKNINIEVERIKNNCEVETEQKKSHRNKNKLQIWLHTSSLERLKQVQERIELIFTLLIIIFTILPLLSYYLFNISDIIIIGIICIPLGVAIILYFYQGESLDFHYRHRVREQQINQHAIEIIEQERIKKLAR